MALGRTFGLVAMTALGAACGDAVRGGDAAMEPPPPTPDHGGTVFVEVQEEQSFGAGAIFADDQLLDRSFQDPTGSTPTHCEERVEGTCRVTTCADAPPPQFAPRLSAGRITIDRGAGTPFSIDPGANNGYLRSVVPFSTFQWQAGDRLTFRAEGGDVPAFTATLPAPMPIALIEPRQVPHQSPDADVPLSQSAGFTVRWQPTDQDVLVRLARGTTSTKVFVRCRFAGSAGQGTVPPTLLALFAPLPPPSPNDLLYLFIGGAAYDTVMAGAYPVVLEAANYNFVGAGHLVP
jgi:hypothetical protein